MGDIRRACEHGLVVRSSGIACPRGIMSSRISALRAMANGNWFSSDEHCTGADSDADRACEPPSDSLSTPQKKRRNRSKDNAGARTTPQKTGRCDSGKQSEDRIVEQHWSPRGMHIASPNNDSDEVASERQRIWSPLQVARTEFNRNNRSKAIAMSKSIANRDVNKVLATLWLQSDIRAKYMASIPQVERRRRNLEQQVAEDLPANHCGEPGLRRAASSSLEPSGH